MHWFDVAGDTVVTVADAMSHPAQVHARREGGRALRIERFNDELLATLRLAEVEERVFAGANDEPVQMWLVYPPGFDQKKAKKYPVLHSIHGGPHSASGDTFHYRWNNQLFAAQGYVVACVNYHGSSGFGNAFLDSITHRWGELELQDVEAATDWLRKQPWVDKSRIFATGGSYGGFMVAWMNGHVKPGRYQAYVCHAGCFDWRAMYADDAYTWHARELGANYWDDPAKIQSQSPDTFAARFATPTLVIHGALDYRVPDQQGLAYYNTLKARGVDARLRLVPGREPLDPQAAQLATLVRRVLRLAEGARPRREGQPAATGPRKRSAANWPPERAPRIQRSRDDMDHDLPAYLRHPTLHGDTIVFVCDDDLWTRERRRRHRAAPDRGPVASPRRRASRPTASWLAFVGRDEQHPEVYLMPAEGGPARRLTWLGPDTLVRGWTPRRATSCSSRPTASRSSATTARSRSTPPAACRELLPLRPGQPPRLRPRQARR